MPVDQNTQTSTKAKTGFGISAALATPFTEDGAIDFPRAVQHASWVLAQGANSITLCGTTGEGASLGLSERIELLDQMINHHIAPEQIVATICTPSLGDAIAQARAFMERGLRRMLLTPPFYFNDVSDEALFNWHADLLHALGDAGPQIILYHIPQITDVPLSATLVARLKSRFPRQIYGVKDSSGNWDSTAAFLQIDGLEVLIGDERQLARGARLGASGAISGMANLFPQRLRHLLDSQTDDPQIDALVNDLIELPVTAAVKALISSVHQQPEWLRTRSPLETTPPADAARLSRHLANFSITGLRQDAA